MGRHWGRGNAGDESNGGGNRVAGDKDGCDGYTIEVRPLKPTPDCHLDLYPSSLHHLTMGAYSVVE